mmetsp:Transcript_17029/g.19455  ORF Transcript_17029/g.19455 Transcript_17029/m.19455 type:complete len:184 (+) Transcript_17029:31-582(+)
MDDLEHKLAQIRANHEENMKSIENRMLNERIEFKMKKEAIKYGDGGTNSSIMDSAAQKKETEVDIPKKIDEWIGDAQSLMQNQNQSEDYKNSGLLNTSSVVWSKNLKRSIQLSSEKKSSYPEQLLQPEQFPPLKIPSELEFSVLMDHSRRFQFIDELIQKKQLKIEALQAEVEYLKIYQQKMQ